MILSLQSEQWVSLHHAYGSGANIPILLQRLLDSTDRQSAEYEELWDKLSNLLCHQGVVGSASYAAVPHLIELAAQLPNGERFTISISSDILKYFVYLERNQISLIFYNRPILQHTSKR